jgi:hypothetical protein
MLPEKERPVNLTEFIDETLSEILAGIRSAQKKDGGGAIGAQMHAAPKRSNLIHGGTSGHFTIVDFDVSVAAEATAGGKAGIRVLSIGGIEGGGERKSQESSRVKFAVHVRIPDGDKVKGDYVPPSYVAVDGEE